MTTAIAPSIHAADAREHRDSAVRAVTLIMGAVVGLTFLFGFGNVWALALRLGVLPWVAPLVAPAVDLSILGLLLAIRRLVLDGADATVILPARRLLVFSSVMTLALNVAEPLITQHYGRAAFDAVGPLLLIGWAEVGPGLLEVLNRQSGDEPWSCVNVTVCEASRGKDLLKADQEAAETPFSPVLPTSADPAEDNLLALARAADLRHWQEHRRPISAESLRKELRVGAGRSRQLVALIRVGGRPPSGASRSIER
ncbi:SpdA protein [Yinghuangia sp. ASG 101]|uniref:SpdA protein n=1 Tax=Yinghuangia sp. ASG 101 TaxID=2896848 RepID=UPI001E63ED96|nr:SpdA protein [Yinghuangia sp. ASG 101]UGQ10455.1 SpdA protein [Yinghuangia sp. ASG 101]